MKALKVPGSVAAVMLPVLIHWLEDEADALPKFNFKIRTPDQHGTLKHVLSKCSADVHMLVVAKDSVDEPTQKILSKGLSIGDIYYVPSIAVQKEFELNGHVSDDGAKNIIIFGFTSDGPMQVLPILKFHEANGSFESELRRSQSPSPYTCAVIYRSRYEEKMDMVEGVARGTGKMIEKVYLDETTDGFLKEKALPITVSNPDSEIDGIPYLRQYYIMPGSYWSDLAGLFADAKKAQTAPRRMNLQPGAVAQL